MNDTYLAYSDGIGFLIGPTRPRSGRDKDKIERRVRDVVGAVVRKGERFVPLDDARTRLRRSAFWRARRS